MKADARVCPSYNTWSWQIGGTPDLSDRGSELGLAGCSSSCGDDSGEDTANCTSAHAGDCYVGEESDATSALHRQAVMWIRGKVLFALTLPRLQAWDNPHLPPRRSCASYHPPGPVGSGDTRSLPSQWQRPSVGDPAAQQPVPCFFLSNSQPKESTDFINDPIALQ